MNAVLGLDAEIGGLLAFDTDRERFEGAEDWSEPGVSGPEYVLMSRLEGRETDVAAVRGALPVRIDKDDSDLSGAGESVRDVDVYGECDRKFKELLVSWSRRTEVVEPSRL